MKSEIVITRRKNNDDELMHWKYIRKTKGKNGKWRYYYVEDESPIDKLKDDLGFDERERLKKAEEELDFSKELHDYTVDRMLNPTSRDYKLAGGVAEWNKYAGEKLRTTNDRIAKAKSTVDKCLKDYGETPLGKMENAIKKGWKRLQSLFTIVGVGN